MAPPKRQRQASATIEPTSKRATRSRSLKSEKVEIPAPKRAKKSTATAASKKKVVSKKEKIVLSPKLEPKSKTYSDGTIPLDPVLERYVSSNAVVIGEYGVVLNQCNIGSNNNKSYRIYVVRDGGDHLCLTRWHRVGEEGSHAKMEGTLETCLKEFEKKFKAKTGNNWKDRADFVKKNGKYDFIKMAIDENESKVAEIDVAGNKEKAVKVKSKLDPIVGDFVEMVFSNDMFRSSMAEIGLDVDRMPLGSLSQEQMESAYAALKEIEKELAKRNPSRAILGDLSSSFYTRFPHATGRAPPPAITTQEMLRSKFELVAVVSDIECAQKLKEASTKNEADGMHPTDAKYETLKSDLLRLKPGSEEWKIIEEYVHASHGGGKLANIYKNDRHGEAESFGKHDKLGNNKLLFHGTSVAVVAAILKSGLIITPGAGGRVGKGIYLASEHSKSYGYTSGTKWKGKQRVVMFLVEAALGKEHEILRDDSSLKKAPKGFHSVVARGRKSPFKEEASAKHISIDGKNVMIPNGAPQPTGKDSSFTQDEYLVYDDTQQRIRYVLEFFL